jgi:uncharacterized membrane protein YjjB (DUF3815 family)
MNLFNLLHDTICGGLAAAGFGVLFNVGFRTLSWCAASGSLALAVRTIALGFGCSFVRSSFLAALALGFAVQLLPLATGVSRNGLHVVGCIPLIPGAFAARCILGLFTVTVQQPSATTNETLLAALNDGLRVVFTIGALGAGIAIPFLLLHLWGTKYARTSNS